MSESTSSILSILRDHEAEILEQWVEEQSSILARQGRRFDLKEPCREFMALLERAIGSGQLEDVRGPEWQETRDFLGQMSHSRAMQGYSPTETALFIFSFKKPFLNALSKASHLDMREVFRFSTDIGLVLDQLGLYTTEVYQKSREQVIKRQQQDLLELSTPVVKLWDGILALPLIGTLDSARAQTVMESLLESIVSTNSAIAILDITGVPTVDTLVAQHLMKTITAARLMGAECIISGIRPQTAQTIVHLGVDLADVTTKATLADAFALAMRRIGKPIEALVNSL